MFAVSFRVPYPAQEMPYAHRFETHNWSHEGLVKRIAAQANGNSPMVVGSDRAGINANNLELAAIALRLPLAIESTAHEPDFGKLMDRAAEAEFFVYKQGGEPESVYFNPYFARLVARVRNMSEFTEIPFGRRLPDGGTACILRNSRVAPSEEFAIDFGGVVALTAVTVARSRESVKLRYGWRWMNPNGINYWSFTHVIGESGKIVAQLDRPLPVASGRVTVGQEIRLRIPQGAGLRLKFGVYPPASGERLKVEQLPAEASRFQVRDDRTAPIEPI
jgi:hypothetical protein